MKGQDKIFYKAGYKYQLQADYAIETSITGYNLGNSYCKLSTNGWLDIRCGYAWDGASGPTFDTKDFMRGSLVHDALYQLMREGALPGEHRKDADYLLYSICREDGMFIVRAAAVLAAVRLFAAPCSEAYATKPVLEAP